MDDSQLAKSVREFVDARLSVATALRRKDTPTPRCCDYRIGMTPGGIPINWHTPDCRGLETRLVEAVLAEPTGTEADVAHLESLAQARAVLMSRLRVLLSGWLVQAHKHARSRFGDDRIQLGAYGAWVAAAAQLATELNLNRPRGGDHGRGTYHR